MSLRSTDNDENAFCGARLQACRVDNRVDVLPAVTGEQLAPEFSRGPVNDTLPY
jgi:hypothetical protein